MILEQFCNSQAEYHTELYRFTNGPYFTKGLYFFDTTNLILVNILQIYIASVLHWWCQSFVWVNLYHELECCQFEYFQWICLTTLNMFDNVEYVYYVKLTYSWPFMFKTMWSREVWLKQAWYLQEKRD